MNLKLIWHFRLIMLLIFCSTLQNVKAQATKSLVYPCVSLSSKQRFNYLDQEISRLDPTQSHLNSFHTYMTYF